MERSNRKNVNPADIVNFWSKIIDDKDLNINWDEDSHKVCWSCGVEPGGGSLNRCHIIPKSLGGEDLPSNMVLLCVQCHRENPNIKDVDLYWDWLKSRARPKYFPTGPMKGLGGLLYWIDRSLSEYVNIFGTDPSSDLLNLRERIGCEIYDFQNFFETNYGYDGQRHSPASMATFLRKWIIQKESDYQNNIVRLYGPGPILEIVK